MMKTKTRPDPIGYAIRLARGVERVAAMAWAAGDLPTGTPALDAAQDAAFEAAERALTKLERLAGRGRR